MMMDNYCRRDPKNWRQPATLSTFPKKSMEVLIYYKMKKLESKGR